MAAHHTLVSVQVKLVNTFIHDKNEEDLIYLRMLLAHRPWEAPPNQVTNTWQAVTEAMRVQQDSKGNFPFQNIAPKTLRSQFNAYLGLEQYWVEKVDPEDDYPEKLEGVPNHPQRKCAVVSVIYLKW